MHLRDNKVHCSNSLRSLRQESYLIKVSIISLILTVHFFNFVLSFDVEKAAKDVALKYTSLANNNQSISLLGSWRNNSVLILLFDTCYCFYVTGLFCLLGHFSNYILQSPLPFIAVSLTQQRASLRQSSQRQIQKR